MLARSLLQISSITSPKDITGCVLWLDAADSSTITESGGAISAWADKSVSGASVTQTVGGNKPSYQSAVKNGKNVVRYDGNDYLNDASSTLLRSVGGWSLFAVFKTTSQTTAQTIVAVATGTTVTRAWLNIAVTTGYKSTGGRRQDADSFASAAGTTQVSTAWEMWAGVGDFATTTATLYVNGAQHAQNTSWLTTGTTPATGGALAVGVNVAGSTAPFSGDIAEVIIYNAALGTAQRQLVESYLKTKWGL